MKCFRMFVAAAVLASMGMLAGCQTDGHEGAIIGGAAGAAGGAAIGAAAAGSGNRGTGAAIGAAVGGVAGAVAGDQLHDKKNRQANGVWMYGCCCMRVAPC